jgi:EAL domain-containing protein (putative c-di-GMP-specific phosphodiesterase class I)
MTIVYQPIRKLGNSRPVGFECLARFAAEPRCSPDKWFTEAAEAGLGTALELAAIRKPVSARLSSGGYLHRGEHFSGNDLERRFA